MARPRKDGLDYFSHDCDAASDPKIKALRRQFGNDGYAFYFILLEQIYRNGYYLDLSNPAIRGSIIDDLKISEERFEALLSASFEVGVFSKENYEENNWITSEGIKKRYLKIGSSRKKWRDAKANEQEKDQQEQFSDEKTPGKTPQRKEKKSIKDISSCSSTTLDIPGDIDNLDYIETPYSPPQNNYDQDYASVIKAWDKASARCMTQYEGEALEQIMQEYGSERVIEAIKIAGDQGKVSLRYVEGVLRNKVAAAVNGGSVPGGKIGVLSRLRNKYGEE